MKVRQGKRIECKETFGLYRQYVYIHIYQQCVLMGLVKV